MDPVRNIEDGTPVGEIIARRELERLAPTDADLAKAAEQMDDGLRLAVPMMMDGLGSDPEPIAAEVDEKLIGEIATTVAHFRADAAADLKRLDKNAPRHIYVEAMVMVAKLDDFLGAVSEYFREVQS